MKDRILLYLKHVIGTVIVLLAIGLTILISEDGGIHYGDNPLKMNWENDGPYIFYKNDSLVSINYIKGNQDNGFYTQHKEISTDSVITLRSYFNLDDTKFDFQVFLDQFSTPPVIYNDGESVFAISDIESGYKSFRDLLINNDIVDRELNWKFGKGHLVLVGDFVDRGFSTTQVLWLIYKLEQEAKDVGGRVHYILGNHELKNLQANFESTSPKYFHVGAIMDKTQHQLYDQKSFIGKWMSSKNTIESINGVLFTHGGLHLDVANLELNLNEINNLIRDNYYQSYYPQKNADKKRILISTEKGPAWYRGYFRDDDLTQEQISNSLKKFNAQSIVVGHTIQGKVKTKFNSQVVGIDVLHPKDYHKNWPKRNSEALFIKDNVYYRALNDGKKIKLVN